MGFSMLKIKDEIYKGQMFRNLKTARTIYTAKLKQHKLLQHVIDG